MCVKADILFANAAAGTQRERADAKVTGHRSSTDINVARESYYWPTESEGRTAGCYDVNADRSAGDARAVTHSILSDGERSNLSRTKGQTVTDSDTACPSSWHNRQSCADD